MFEKMDELLKTVQKVSDLSSGLADACEDSDQKLMYAEEEIKALKKELLLAEGKIKEFAAVFGDQCDILQSYITKHKAGKLGQKLAQVVVDDAEKMRADSRRYQALKQGIPFLFTSITYYHEGNIQGIGGSEEWDSVIDMMLAKGEE